MARGGSIGSRDGRIVQGLPLAVRVVRSSTAPKGMEGAVEGLDGAEEGLNAAGEGLDRTDEGWEGLVEVSISTVKALAVTVDGLNGFAKGLGSRVDPGFRHEASSRPPAGSMHTLSASPGHVLLR